MDNRLLCPIEQVEQCLVVRPAGTLDHSTYPVLRDTLLKCAVDQPEAVIVDLADLVVGTASVLSVFTTVWLRTCDWPAVPILLVANTGQALLLRRSTVQRYMTVHPGLPEALASVGHPPLRRRSSRTLPNDLASPRAARRFVEQTCASWRITGSVAADAVQVTSELVENTVVHTLSDARVRLELCRGVLTVAVSDESPAPAVMVDPGADAHNAGRGVHLLAQLARTWGCIQDRVNGGKTVWAVLRNS
jgi:anti-sigma regulatory factor (Ser/Thr protein kinase)